MNSMTSKERIHATVHGQDVDRVPVYIWLNAHTGAKLMAEYHPAKRKHWNLVSRFLWNRFRKGGLANAPELWRFLPLTIDVHMLNWANAYAYELGSDMALASYGSPWRYANFFLKKGNIYIKDLYGVTRTLGKGIYPDAVGPAITSIEDTKTYRFPDYRKDSLYSIFRKYRRDYPDKSIAAEIWGSQDFTATSLFGMERFMIYLVDYPDEMKAFMKRWADFHIEVAVRCIRAGADVLFILDDYGYDHRPLISPAMWKEFTLPQLKRIVEAGRNEGALVALHSCGYQMPFLEYYADAGIQLLHSFQPKAGNDFEKAHAEFGDRLTFINGIDIQQGEQMTPDQLKEDILRYYKTGGQNGGHVLGTTHEIQYTMPFENIIMILDTVREIQEGVYG